VARGVLPSSGGFDRVLGAMPGRSVSRISPPGRLRDPVRARAHDRAVGAGPNTARGARRARTHRGRPRHTLVGNWEVLLGDTEVCTLWATSLEDHVAMARRPTSRGVRPDRRDRGDARLPAWREQARAFTTLREELMVRAPARRWSCHLGELKPTNRPANRAVGDAFCDQCASEANRRRTGRRIASWVTCSADRCASGRQPRAPASRRSAISASVLPSTSAARRRCPGRGSRMGRHGELAADELHGTPS